MALNEMNRFITVQVIWAGLWLALEGLKQDALDFRSKYCGTH